MSWKRRFRYWFSVLSERGFQVEMNCGGGGGCVVVVVRA
jgi:ferredoxin